MTVPNFHLKTTRSRQSAIGSVVDFDQRWRRAAAVSSSTTQLRLLECEDRSTPSVAPFYAVASDHFADSLLTSSAAIRNELVIIDPTVPDYQRLIHDLQLNSDSFRHFEFFVLSATRDGLDQVSEALAHRNDLDAVHFITHGVGGAIRIGNSWIDHRALQQRGGQVAQWSNALTPGADVLFYGCDLAASAAGQQFLQSFRQLTKADVAASTDRTGSGLRGGDWDLEYHTGAIETGIAFSPTLQKTYAGTLALFVVTSNNDSGTGSLRDAITKANATVGADTISFSFGEGGVLIRPNSPLPIITDVVTIDATTMTGYAGTPLVELDGSNTSGTGLEAQARVMIRGLAIYNFSAYGIWLNGTGANSSLIQACHLGTDGNGKNDLGNGQYGISVVDAQSITIGGTTAGSGNLISGNTLGGITFSGPSSSNNLIQGNRIGTDVTGLNSLANSGHGILLQNGANNSIIGGTAAGAGNIIAFNSGDGIRLIGSNTGSNQFYANSIHSNGGLGIDLDGDGPTLNDKGDSDTGANALMNYPVLTMVLTNGTQVTISGTYHGVGSASFRLELYASSTSDSSGFGEGARYLGFVTYSNDISGNGKFNVTLAAPVAAGEFVSAIATELSNRNSSEFSLSVTAIQPQVIVTPISGLITTEAGGTASFTVKLGAEPTAKVVIPITVSNIAEGKVSVTSLTFTSANWSTAQTVFITGLDDFVADGDQPYTIVIGNATSTDANFNGSDGDDVSVVNVDDEIAGILVTPTSGLVTTEAGGTALFSVVLTSQPVGTLTIAVASSNPAEGTVSVSSLTFTAANWNVPQTVVVTGVDDFWDDGNVAYSIILSPAVSVGTPYDGVDPTDVSVTNNDNDTAGFIVNPISGLITTESGGQATFTVRLTNQPTANVTINLTSANTVEGLVNVATLTFTAANWNIDQVVTISGIDDFVDDGDVNYMIVLSPATSSDGNYNGLDATDVSVSNLDNDSAGIIVTATSGLTTTEAGGQATFSVRLSSQPVATVTIFVGSANGSEGMTTITSLTFTAANWNVDHIVTVTGVDDFVVDGDVGYTIIVGPASSSDAIYNGMDGDDISVTNIDDDTASIVVTPTAGLVTTEAGGQASFTIRLTSQPLGPVTISLVSSNSAEGVVSVVAVSFTAANWNLAQIVTITGVNDFFADGNVAFTVVVGPAASSDGLYQGLDGADVVVVNNDNDAAGILVTPAGAMITTEAGGSAAFSVRLTSQPTGTVVIQLSSTRVGEGVIDFGTLVFSPADWNVPKTIVVTGIDDFLDDGDQTYAVRFQLSTSADPQYHTLPTPDVSVINENDDVAGFVIVGGPQLSVDESGTSASIQIVLTSQPIAPVTFVVTSTIPGEVQVATTIVTFNPTNWLVPQSVTFHGVADSVEDPDVVVAILVESASFDPLYDQRGAALTVTNRNVFREVSDDSLSTAVPTGTGVPRPVEENVQLDDRALTTSTQIMIQGSSQRFALGGSGGGEEEDTTTTEADSNSTADMAGLVPMDRPGLSPTSNQRIRRAAVTLPPNVMAVALPTLRFEPIRESSGKMDRDLREESGFRSATVRVTVSTAAVASAGYVLWSLRGAAWVASAVASSLPAWSAFDPLVLLARKQRDDEHPGDSLTDMIESAQTV